MADEKLGSRRMSPVGGPSGSGTRQGVSGSGIRPAATPTGSGRQTGSGSQAATPNERQPSARRAPVEAPPPPPPPVPARRGVAGPPRKQAPLPIKEMMIAGGGILLIIAICLVIYVVKNGEQRDAKAKIKQQNDLYEANIELGRSELARAEKVGTLFIVGEETVPEKDRTKLFGPFEGNKQIFNVIYDRGYMDKKSRNAEAKHDVRMLNDDPERYKFAMLSKGVDEGKLNISYILVNNGKTPAIKAKKVIPGKPNDPANAGGQIEVWVLAQQDDYFERAMKKTSEGLVTDATPAATKPASTPTTTAATTPAATPAK
jgi:hypothetical protein